MEESDECRMRIDALIPRYCDLIFFEVGTDDCMCDNAGIATAASICFCVDIKRKGERQWDVRRERSEFRGVNVLNPVGGVISVDG